MAAILVVDDEEDIRELVGIYLKNEGFNCGPQHRP